MKAEVRAFLRKPVLEALRNHGGAAHLSQVAKYVWDHYQREILASPNLVYTWQYDYRWVAMELRKEGLIRPATESPKGVWELSTRDKT